MYQDFRYVFQSITYISYEDDKIHESNLTISFKIQSKPISVPKLLKYKDA